MFREFGQWWVAPRPAEFVEFFAATKDWPQEVTMRQPVGLLETLWAARIAAQASR